MKNMKIILTSFLATAFLGVQADIFTNTSNHLVQWTFATNLEPTTVATGATASEFGRSDALTTGGHSTGPGPNLDGSSYINNEPYIGGGANDLPNNQAGRTFARPWNDLNQAYHDFSITANDQSFALASIGFDVGWRQTGGNEMRVQYSFSSDFSNPVTVAHMAGHTAPDDVGGLGVGPVDSDTGLPTTGVSTAFGGTENFSWNRYVFDINDTLAQGQTVYFRIQGSGGTGNIHMDNVTVAIPEPGTLALVGIVLGSLLLFRRRRT
jgi:hypothetical protein